MPPSSQQPQGSKRHAASSTQSVYPRHLPRKRALLIGVSGGEDSRETLRSSQDVAAIRRVLIGMSLMHAHKHKLANTVA
jgi:hypothetical protein